MKQMTFIGACREFFGTKEGQTLKQFGEEIKSLSEKERAELVEMFKTVDIDATKVAQ
jgi:hypothetical protein